MQISYGLGGWLRVDAPDMPGPLYLRYRRSERGRPVLTEFYLDGRGNEIPTGLLRTLDLASLTAAALHEEGQWLESSGETAGPDLSRLASHYATTWFKATHWVALSQHAQIAGSNVEQAPMGANPKPRELVAPKPVRPPEHGLTDEFLRSVADNYAWAARCRQPPAPMIKKQLGPGWSERTVHAWIRKARERGILAPTTKGRVG